MSKKSLFLFSLLMYVISINPILPVRAENHESAKTGEKPSSLHELVPLFSQPVHPELSLLIGKEIDRWNQQYTIKKDHLYVLQTDHKVLVTKLVGAGLLPNATSTGEAKDLEETNIWTPSDVREDRKRIIKQTELARVIAQFPDVEKAEVFICESPKRRLNTTDPIIKVSVILTTSKQVSKPQRLASSTTDLVSGCIHNLKRNDVKVFINGELTSAPKYPRKLYFSNRQFLQNSLTYTNHPLDLGIRGDGYFKLRINRTIVDEKGNTRTQQDEGYTRLGILVLDEDGSLIHYSSKYLLEPSITFPEGSYNITIREDGRVLVDVNGDREEIGEMALYRFPNPSDLIEVANHIFVESERSGPPTEGTPGDPGFGSLAQGYLEEIRFLSSDEKDHSKPEAESTSQQNLKKTNPGESQVTF